MTREDSIYQMYLRILKEELITAMGCTEPVAISYAAAKAREILGELPDRVVVRASGSIIKNVKSVIVPHTNGMKGIEAAAGAGIVYGKALLELEGHSVRTRAKAMAAAGSDARMNGCELPVVINSGSGNQGITCSVSVLVYGEELACDEEKIYRALVLSNLIAIYIKSGIGTLSAYCGAVSAGASAGAGIAYLCGGGYEEVKHTVVNALAIVSGMVCDGAKASCAAKIAASVDAGILGYYMYINNQQFYAGEGIGAKGVDQTISNIGKLGSEGMKETNEKIIEMLIK